MDRQGEEEEEEAVLRTETRVGGKSRSVPSSAHLSPFLSGREVGTRVLWVQRDAKNHFAAWCCPWLWCLLANAPPAHRQPLPDPLPDAAGSNNVISLSLISRARLCVPSFPPTSLAFIDSPLIRLEGEVRSNGINDGVRALLAAACDGKVTGRDHCPGLAKLAPSIGAGLGDGDLPCHWDPCNSLGSACNYRGRRTAAARRTGAMASLAPPLSPVGELFAGAHVLLIQLALP